MATSMIEMPTKIHDIKIVYTAVQPSGSIAAHFGAAGDITPTAPSGYRFLTHIAIWNTGVIGLVVSFDGVNGAESTRFYQNNTTDNQLSSRGTVNLLTAYYR